MLSPPHPSTSTGAGSPWRSLALAWRPASRGLPRLTIAAVLAMALLPAVVLVIDGGHDPSGALTAAALLTGTCAAFCVHDPAGETLAASPCTLLRRRLLRLSAIAAAAGLIGLLALALATGHGPLDLGRRAVELMAAAGLATGAAGIAHRQDPASAGAVGAVIGGLGVLMISSLAFRFHALPTLAGPAHHARWWLVALAGWTAAAWTTRDPAR